MFTRCARSPLIAASLASLLIRANVCAGSPRQLRNRRVAQCVAAGVAWPELNAANESAIHLRGAGGNIVDRAVYADRCEFWDGLGYEWVLNP